MKEEEIRPKSIFDEYLRLARIDIEIFFDDVVREFIDCPACGTKGRPAFNKHGFDYELCINCDTLFVSPRPVNDAFVRYYSNASSTEYWATTFYKATADARREKLWRPKAKLIHNMCERFGLENGNVVDVGGGYGIFAEEMFSLFGRKTTIIEPGLHLAKSCRDRGLRVVEKFLEEVQTSDLPKGRKVFVSFELFEHLHSPELFLKQLYKLMTPGDLFIFTTLSGTGVDIQGLWEDSESVSPPHHLNFFNPHSIKILTEKIGFKLLQVSTPGKLDVDILNSNIDLIKDRFLKTLVKYATDSDKLKWQKLIADSGWSSHMMACCQKQ